VDDTVRGSYGLLPAESDPYVSWRQPLRGPELAPGKTCLLIIDMTYEDASWEHGNSLIARDAGFESEFIYWRDKLKRAVDNIAQLQAWARERGIEVMFVRVASLTADGRDRSNLHKDLGYHQVGSDPVNAILAEIAPVGDEIVLDKTTSSAFGGTIIDRLLRNMGIEEVIFTGVLTNGCVESAVRDAADIGYRCVVVEDACAAYLADIEAASLRVMRNVYATILSTSTILRSPAVAARGPE
jgi:nicotinamidase-related amidase